MSLVRMLIPMLLLCSDLGGTGSRYCVGDEPPHLVLPPVLEMLPGVVEPVQKITVSAPLGAELMTLSVGEGASVRRGQLLAIMDNRVAEAAVQVATQEAENDAEIRLASNQCEAAEQHLRRTIRAHQRNAASDRELDESKSNVKQSEIVLQRAHERQAMAYAQLKLERSRLALHEMRAPFDGQVLRVVGRPGQFLDRADSVLTLANFKSLRVELHVPVTWYGRISANHQYWLDAPAPVGKTIPAKLVSFEPQIDAATQTFRCLFSIDNEDQSLPAGFTVRLVEPKGDQSGSTVQSSLSQVGPVQRGGEGS